MIVDCMLGNELWGCRGAVGGWNGRSKKGRREVSEGPTDSPR